MGVYGLEVRAGWCTGWIPPQGSPERTVELAHLGVTAWKSASAVPLFSRGGRYIKKKKKKNEWESMGWRSERPGAPAGSGQGTPRADS